MDFREEIKTYFSHNFCNTIEHALKLQFPNIQNLQVDMNEEGVAHVMFDETEYTQTQVEDYLNEFKKTSPTNEHH